MIRRYTEQNVYEALQDRLHFLFEEFDNIFVSFSGGKDSGLLLNLTLDFQKKYYPEKKIGVFHQDFEAQYSVTTEYIERTFERIKNDAELYWVCLPMATRTALSSYQMFWYPWDDTKEDVWVRPMPRHPYVINLQNNPITTYRYKMHQIDLAKQFGRWYRISHGGKKTVCLLGMRADESLQRYSGILNKRHGYKERNWISRQFKDVWAASPLYDWSKNDVWHANYIFNYDRDHLICYKSYPSEKGKRECHLIISKQDGRITHEIQIPSKGIETPVVTEGEFVITPEFYLTFPDRDKWIFVNTSSDTIFHYLPDGNLSPFIVRSPSISSMDTKVFLFPTVITDRYCFMRTMRKEVDFTTFKGFLGEDLVYDKQENALFSYILYNDDFINKEEVSLTSEPRNPEIAICQTLDAPDLVEAYEKGQLKGKLKEIAANLDEESNPVVMLLKKKK